MGRDLANGNCTHAHGVVSILQEYRIQYYCTTQDFNILYGSKFWDADIRGPGPTGSRIFFCGRVAKCNDVICRHPPTSASKKHEKASRPSFVFYALELQASSENTLNPSPCLLLSITVLKNQFAELFLPFCVLLLHTSDDCISISAQSHPHPHINH